MSVAAAVAKMSAGRVEITFARMADILGGRAERTDVVFFVVEAQRVTTRLTSGVGVGGGRTALPLVRMNMHARAKEKEEVLGAPLALVVGSASPLAATHGTSLT